MYDFPIRLLSGQDVFGGEYLKPRKPLPKYLQSYVDHILYYGRFTTMIDTHNRFKFENVPYTKEELAKCRLLTKSLNGTVLAVDIFNTMYPDAVFFGLVRNGLAICEGYTRRGIAAEEAGRVYKIVVDKMLEANKNMNNYFLLKYEDMVSNPLEFMQQVYECANLDLTQVKKARLQSKKIMSASGTRDRLKGGDRQVFWYDLSSLQEHIKPNINENQIHQLKTEDKKAFLSIAGDSMEACGYVI